MGRLALAGLPICLSDELWLFFHCRKGSVGHWPKNHSILHQNVPGTDWPLSRVNDKYMAQSHSDGGMGKVRLSTGEMGCTLRIHLCRVESLAGG